MRIYDLLERKSNFQDVLTTRTKQLLSTLPILKSTSQIVLTKQSSNSNTKQRYLQPVFVLLI